jgi:hypothetical protein
VKKQSRLKPVLRMKKRGRPKRDATILSQLLAWEFQWQITFAVLREGAPNWDASIPNPETVGLKWLRSPGTTLPTEAETKFWREHYQAHIKEAEAEFNEKIVHAEPRDIPAEPELWKLLSDPRTGPAAVRRACRRSQHYLRRSPGYTVLYLGAKQFCRAKRDARYPRSNRKSSEGKRAEYLARVMAGLSLPKPMRPATAVDLLRKMKHDKHCPCWRCALKPTISSSSTHSGVPQSD